MAINLNDTAAIVSQLNLITRQTGFGEISIANALMLRGFNHRGLGNPVTTNLDGNGMVFFTRPNLNLSEGNLLTKRILSVLASSEEYSLQRMVRALLDPRSNWCADIPVSARRHNTSPISTPLVDRYCPFIPMLSNNLLTLSGWKDIDMDSYTSPEGKSRQTYSHIDSVGDIWDSFSLTANFRNVAGDPITLMFLVWLLYSGWVYRGELMPYPESNLENEIDYCTRIYRLVLDPSRRYVQKIACCGYSYPTAISIGAAMNYDATKPISDENSQITVPFKATGAYYNDPIIVYWFNKIVTNFCPPLKNAIAGSSQDYVRINNADITAMNHRGLPYIDPNTLELQWWISSAESSYYNSLKGTANGQNQ